MDLGLCLWVRSWGLGKDLDKVFGTFILRNFRCVGSARRLLEGFFIWCLFIRVLYGVFIFLCVLKGQRAIIHLLLATPILMI